MIPINVSSIFHEIRKMLQTEKIISFIRMDWISQKTILGSVRWGYTESVGNTAQKMFFFTVRGKKKKI